MSNTIDNTGFGPIVFGGTGSGAEGTGVSDIDIVNNIGSNNPPGGYGVECYENPSNYRIHGNLFFSVQLVSNCTLGPANSVADPLYVGGGDYRLRAGSPGIEAKTALGSTRRTSPARRGHKASASTRVRTNARTGCGSESRACAHPPAGFSVVFRAADS